MINAIIPIPNRYPLRYRLGTGFMMGCGIGVSGRAVTVLPLRFYKFFSTYQNAQYQHIFASDCLIDTALLSRDKNIFNGQESNNCGTLVPISVKRTTLDSSATFLFPRCINFLLRRYKVGVPLDEVDVVNTPISCELSPFCVGVTGISEFNFRYLRGYMMEHNWCGFTENDRLLMSATTPELPHKIGQYADEIAYTKLHGNALASYILDLCSYEKSNIATLNAYLSMYNYNFVYDPITLLCVSTPSYLYGHQLRCYLGDELQLRMNSKLSHVNIDAPIPFITERSVDLVDPYSWNAELIEMIMDIGADDFVVNIDAETSNILTDSMIPAYGNSAYIPLANCASATFGEAKKIEIAKNWMDEVYITLWDRNMNPKTFYINLAWYHLVTPSLINTSLVE